MWAPAYASAAELAAWLGVDNTDAELELAAEAASRAIDKACNRQFGQDATARFYTPVWQRDRYWIESDDLVAGEPVVIERLDESDAPIDTITNYVLTPRNAPADGRPYSRIELGRGVSVSDPLRVTATWGWANVPPAIRAACLIQAGRIWGRRETPAAPLTSLVVDDAQLGWAATAKEVDADVMAMIRPYINTRSWVVA